MKQQQSFVQNIIKKYKNDEDNDQFEFIHENPTGKCLLNKICVSNQCSHAQKLCCDECYQEFHPAHHDKVEEYNYAYRQLKRSINEKRTTMNKCINQFSEQQKKLIKQRKKMAINITRCFERIDSYCQNVTTLEVAHLKKKFEEEYDMDSFNHLKVLTEQQKQKKSSYSELIHYTNKVFSQYTSEVHPYLQFKGNNENKFIDYYTQNVLDIQNYLKDINLQLKKYSNSISRRNRYFTQTHLINYHTCEVNKYQITFFDSPINQLLVLNFETLVVSLTHDIEIQSIQFVKFKNYNYTKTVFYNIPHTQLVDLKQQSTILVVSEYKITKIKYSEDRVYTLKSIHFTEKVIQVDFVQEMNSIIVITKNTNIANQNLKYNLYRAQDLILIKRYQMQDSSKTILLAHSFSLNLLISSSQRHLKIYHLISGQFISYSVIGDTMNDDIIDIKFQKSLEKQNRENLIISNVQGLVTTVYFPSKKQQVILKKNLNEKISFVIIDELKLFTDKRYLQIVVTKGNTILKYVKLKKKNNQKSEIVDEKIELFEEYTCHYSFNDCRGSSIYHLFVGTILGGIFHISYQNK